MKLRDAMRFDDDRAAHYLERGWWSTADTLSQWLVRAASETPDAPAIVGDGQSLSYRPHGHATGTADDGRCRDSRR